MAPAGMGAVFLLTDYGQADEFAGVVRAVVARDAPGAPIVDLSHQVPAFDVRAGALALMRCVPHLGPGVLLAIVDPEVGTGRRALAVEVPGEHAATSAGPAAGESGGGPGPGPRYVLGPDNGLLPWVLDALGGPRRAVALRVLDSTFDGRDVFAPAAAALWRGDPLESVGEPVDADGLVRLPPARLLVGDGMVEAEVLWVDRFGNAQLAAAPADASRAGLGPVVDVVLDSGRGVPGRMTTSFGDLGDDEIGVVEDANGMLALVCNRAPAATVLGVQPGDMVGLRSGEHGTVIGRIQPGGRT